MKTGINLVHVPFKSSAQALADVIAGNTQMELGTLVSKIGPIRSGRLRILGVGGLKRSPVLPDVPTISESGVPGYETYIWFGMFAPARTPPAIIARMHDAIEASLRSPDVVKRLTEQGVRLETMSTVEFGKLMMSEQAKWLDVVKAAGM